MDKGRWRGVLLGWVVLSMLSCSLVTGEKPTVEPTVSPSWQETVDALDALTQDLGLPQHLMQKDGVKTGEEFDVATYFTVLDHLSMEPGYVLDYVYRYDGMGGMPVLYARPADQPPYATYQAYADASPDAEADSYLEHVRVDDTEEGYFQFVLLRLMGNQFYLFWHAAYNDIRPVCSRATLDEILTDRANKGYGLEMPAEDRRAAERLDLEPQVVLDEETARVRLVTFTLWGGFIEQTYTIRRAFPHEILDIEETTLIEYDCGIMF